ncbi:MAG: sigma-70 family RNA polymerase sigma factor, partial [Bacteroidales bacterium]|nr:sigma-70 family RNA polymerase sigma factor [Bacteroidales bacterium]
TLRQIEDSEALPESYDQREEDRSLVEELHEVIAQLDEPDRTIVTMKLEGYSYKEIAQKLDTTEKNVSVRLVRVKDKLRKEMTK